MRVDREFSSKIAKRLETIEESKLGFLLGHISEKQISYTDEVSKFDDNLKKLTIMDKKIFLERLELGRKQIATGETFLADADYFDKKIAMIEKMF